MLQACLRIYLNALFDHQSYLGSQCYLVPSLYFSSWLILVVLAVPSFRPYLYSLSLHFDIFPPFILSDFPHTSQITTETSNGNYPWVRLPRLWTGLPPSLSCLNSSLPSTTDELPLLLSEKLLHDSSICSWESSVKWLFLLFPKSLTSPCLLNLIN